MENKSPKEAYDKGYEDGMGLMVPIGLGFLLMAAAFIATNH